MKDKMVCVTDLIKPGTHTHRHKPLYRRAISGIWVTAKLQKSIQSTVVSQDFSKPDSQVSQHEPLLQTRGVALQNKGG